MTKKEFLSAPLEKIFEEFKRTAPYKRTEEISILNPVSSAGIHIREDGKLELFAGNAVIILDGESSNILMSCNEIQSTVSSHKESFSGNGGFMLDGMELDPFWYSDNHADVIIPKEKDSLDKLYLLAGAPSPGQRNVALSDLLKSKKLFRLKKLTDGIKSLL